tara:strand:+ start:913 stop:1107 length:195 start_codon:yes stop_codon:yes gene_type:complete
MSSVNVEVFSRRNESAEQLIKRFSRKVRKEGILEQHKEKMYYEKRSDKRRRMKKKAKKQSKQEN